MLSKLVLFLALSLLPVFWALAEPENCLTPKHYEEIGCTPVLEDNEICPKRFDCGTVLGRTGNQCYFQGVSYKEGEHIPGNLTNGACQASCFCRDGVITCANIECPEIFGPYKQGCVPQQSEESCCAQDYICDEAAIEELPTCYLDGRKYRKGQKMYPETRSCYTCICDEGFDNSTKLENNTHCNFINCGIELHSSDDVKNGCTPIYYETPICCPIGWRCPQDSDSVLEGEGRTNDEDPNMECKFGRLTLKVGNQLSSLEGPSVKCECTVPPMVTCIQTS
ncbi:kielin/chordin-like protein [Phlebotomus argentipes]|uniref:kielin/chordin-like protein n=1 Tax=Phlebotomus argentipes TaxID=94469 RepID=UPI00289307E1|nr:kielin/chordin-like protein [Phlebotomus argentipes]